MAESEDEFRGLGGEGLEVGTGLDGREEVVDEMVIGRRELKGGIGRRRSEGAADEAELVGTQVQKLRLKSTHVVVLSASGSNAGGFQLRGLGF